MLTTGKRSGETSAARSIQTSRSVTKSPFALSLRETWSRTNPRWLPVPRGLHIRSARDLALVRGLEPGASRIGDVLGGGRGRVEDAGEDHQEAGCQAREPLRVDDPDLRQAFGKRTACGLPSRRRVRCGYRLEHDGVAVCSRPLREGRAVPGSRGRLDERLDVGRTCRDDRRCGRRRPRHQVHQPQARRNECLGLLTARDRDRGQSAERPEDEEQEDGPDPAPGERTPRVRGGEGPDPSGRPQSRQYLWPGVCAAPQRGQEPDALPLTGPQEPRAPDRSSRRTEPPRGAACRRPGSAGPVPSATPER